MSTFRTNLKLQFPDNLTSVWPTMAQDDYDIPNFLLLTIVHTAQKRVDGLLCTELADKHTSVLERAWKTITQQSKSWPDQLKSEVSEK